MAIPHSHYEQQLEDYWKSKWNYCMDSGNTADAEYCRQKFKQQLEQLRMYGMDNSTAKAMMARQQDAYNTAAGMQANMAAQQSSIYNSALGQQQMLVLDTSGSLGIGTTTSGAVSKDDFIPEFGTLYLHNKPLPEDWSGAKITSYQRRADSKHWNVLFESKWDKALGISLYLDIEEHNGKDVDTAARTFMEALNQRRAG